jgi:hypothetical protein
MRKRKCLNFKKFIGWRNAKPCLSFLSGHVCLGEDYDSDPAEKNQELCVECRRKESKEGASGGGGRIEKVLEVVVVVWLVAQRLVAKIACWWR